MFSTFLIIKVVTLLPNSLTLEKAFSDISPVSVNLLPITRSSDLFLENIDAKIGDVVTVTIMASEFSIKIIDTINYFPTLYPDTEPFVIAELSSKLQTDSL